MQLAEPMAVAVAVPTQVAAQESMVSMRQAAAAVLVGATVLLAMQLVTVDLELLLFVIQSLHLRQAWRYR